jgi:tRNA pseudouridine55 synthase
MNLSSGIKKQAQRNKQELNGIVVVDKPRHMTSAKVVASVKHLLRAKKVGHTGTLDPFAEGVLVCCINKATRLATFLLAGNKTYRATLKLGIETDTQDSTGSVTAVTKISALPEEIITSAIKKFEGRIEQQPPVFSALKHKGTPLYKLARRGRPIQKPARPVQISKIKILAIKLPLVHLEIACSAGTYIRTLCADIGKHLGCGGHLFALKRIESCGFKIQQANSLAALEHLVSKGDPNGYMISMADALKDMPACLADQSLISKIRQGRPVNKADLNCGRLFESTQKQALKIKIVDTANTLLAVLNYETAQDRISYACVFAN